MSLREAVSEAESLDHSPGLRQCKRDVLSDLCRRLGRSTSGTMEELIARIHEACTTFERNEALRAQQSTRPSPISFISPAGAPNRYIISEHKTRCCSCGSIHSTFQTFAEQSLRRANVDGDATASTRYVLHRVPVAQFEWNVPVVRQGGSYSDVAACPSCPSLDLTHLPRPPVVSLEARALANYKQRLEAEALADRRKRGIPLTLDQALDF